MVYRPLSDISARHLGVKEKTSTPADDEVAELPGGVFFGASRTDEAPGTLPGLYYKDATDIVRRVCYGRDGRFRFDALPESGQFRSIGDVLFVPDLDPRAWATHVDLRSRTRPSMSGIRPGTFFTGLVGTETLAQQRLGVYRLDNDGMFRRLLKERARGLKWSEAIPSDRFVHFGESLAVGDDAVTRDP